MNTFSKVITGIIVIHLAFFFIYILAFYYIPSESEKNVFIDDLAFYMQEKFIAKDFNLSCKFVRNDYSHYTVQFNGVSYPKFTEAAENNSYDFECMNKYNSYGKKLILFWNQRFGRDDFSYGIGNGSIFKKSKCPVYNCETTNDKKRLKESDMILFHMRDSIGELPKIRRSLQRWVFILHESQLHSNDFSNYDGLFNITSTFKLDSNTTSSYYSAAGFIWQHNKEFDESHDYSKGKTEFAFAIISNCNDQSGRMKYIHELKKNISVKIYGGCGEPCPKAYENGTEGDCKAILSEKYKFYLAFENSICKDYITEKFFGTLKYDLIPVVLGGDGYDYYVPKEAYINVKDFKSPQDLASYLIYLDNNKIAYNSYFKWKKHTMFHKHYYEIEMCELCIMLNLDSVRPIKKSVVERFDDYWNKNKDCKLI